MADVHDAPTRSRNMAAIRGADTGPELLIRRALHARGFRYRLHVKTLPGKPDLVFPARRAVVLINGCFWHGHDCPLFKWPKSREDFWRAKIGGNMARDAAQAAALRAGGWRIARVWDCALRGRSRPPFETVIERLSLWLCSEMPETDLTGRGAE
ncbi:very short patch repair endonuclease [Falsigemmobacter faecalis]|uniref:DNA mismatch endonuclease Vsr n=1 Tax=Falsigemmobacter faecalis TaxID=2488730 RepID=A0A3P3DQU3_9RHOB|nr:very short patch repair endonuclease [Falsigemmobacter faecalis]RRH76637.1 DNA mismatch endonuclease Vsr [Falsigemmobacter faecalis]